MIAAIPAVVPVVSQLGFLGVGWIGLKRLDALVSSGAARAAAIADTSEETLDSARAIAPEARVASSLEALLEEPVDGLVIATPSALHAGQAIAALERGVAVFCQKPLAASAAEARRVVDIARRVDRLLGLDLCYRHLAGVQAMRELLASGELGHVFAIEATFHNAYGPSKAWCCDRRLSGGGCVIDLGIHLVDLALWLLDFPAVTSVSSRLTSGGTTFKGGGEDVEDFASCRLQLACDTTASLSCSWFLPIGQDAIIRIACYGTKGGVLLENVGGSFVDFAAWRLRGSTREPLAMPPDDWGGRAALAWTAQLASNPRFDDRAEQFVAVAEVLDRIYASCEC